MLRIKSALLFILFTLGLTTVKAQVGSLEGYVLKESFDSTAGKVVTDTLEYAEVSIINTSFSAYGDPTKYLIEGITPGVYQVYSSTLDQMFSITEDSVVIKTGRNYLDFYVSTVEQVDNKVVEFVYVKETKDESSFEDEKQNADVAKDIQDAESIANSGNGGNAANATKAVAGVTVVGGKYVFIRGLSDRYSKTVLNQAEIPGLDPNKNSVQLDLFPTSFISSLDVIKTYTPEYPGDWAGGLLDLRTKSFPDSLLVTLKVGGTYNTQSSFNSSFLTYDGGGVDFLGFDDGTRDLPDFIQTSVDNGSVNDLLPITPQITQEELNATEKANKAFDNNYLTKTKLSGINSSISFTIGNSKKWVPKKAAAKGDTLFKKKFGYFVGASYKQKFDYFKNGTKKSYSLPTSVDADESLNPERDFSWERGRQSVLFGSIVNFKYIPNQNNRLKFNYIHNHGGIATAENTVADKLVGDFVDRQLFNNTLRYTERAMNTLQLIGEHEFSPIDSAKQSLADGSINKRKIDWIVSYTLARQDEPDLRFSPYFKDPTTGEFFLAQAEVFPPSRYFRFMTEHNIDGKVNYTFSKDFKRLPMTVTEVNFKGETFDTTKVKRARNIEFKIGASEVAKLRDFEEYRFEVNGSDSAFNAVGGNVEDLLSDDNLTPNNGTFVTTYKANFEDKNQYKAQQSITAGYLKIKVPLTERLKFVGGARDEFTYITLESNSGATSELIRNDILPSANFSYSIIDNLTVVSKRDTSKVNTRNLKLRLAYNKTLARPSFRELAPYAVDDFDTQLQIQGNPNLDRTLIDNYDLRLEYYPRSLELISFSAFYKELINPIELRAPAVGQGKIFVWSQGTFGQVYGVEFDIKKRLDVIHSSLESFTFGTNVTLSQSKIKIDEKELNEIIRPGDPYHADTRPLFGQSPYIVNAYLELEPDTARQSDSFKQSTLSKITNGMLFRVNYNLFGDRLARVTFDGTADIYEKSRGSLNIVVSKKFSERVKLTLKGSNLLNPEYKQVYKFVGDNAAYKKFNDQEFVFTSYKKGINISGSLSFKF